MTARVSRRAEDPGRSSSAEILAASSSGRDRAYQLALLLILVLAAWLRGIQLNESLWLDELHTAWIVSDGWSEIPWRAGMGNQSPLYFYLAAAVTRIFGLNEVALRLPSAVAGVLLVLVAAWLVRRWTGSRAAGLLSALLLALDRNAVFYSQEARSYALVQLVGMIHVGVFAQVLAGPSRRWRGIWVATGILLFYLHYTAALLLVAELVACALLALAPAWRPACRWRERAVDFGLIALGLLPSVPHLLQIADRRDAWALFISRRLGPAEIFGLFPLEIYLLLPAGICAAAWLAVKLTGRLSARRTVAGCPPSAGWSFAWDNWSFGSAGRLDPRLLVALGCWLFVPLTVAWVLTVGDVARVFFLRYVVVSAAAAALLSGISLLFFPGSVSRMICGLTLAAALVMHGGYVGQVQRDGRVIGDRRQDWRGAVSWLQQNAIADRGPVFVRSGLIEADRLRPAPAPRLREYCLLPVRGIYRLNVPGDDLIPLRTSQSGRLEPSQVRRIVAAGQAWFLLVGSRRTVDHIEAELRASIARAGPARIAAQRQAFGDVTVLGLCLEPAGDW